MPIAAKYTKLIVRDSSGELVQMLPEVQTGEINANSNLPVSGATIATWGEAFVRNTGENETIAGNKTFTGTTTCTNDLEMSGKKISNPAGIEMAPAADDAGNGGYIDFHYNKSSENYTSRIIESSSGTISVNNVSLTNGTITATTFTGSLVGNADTATKLATARDINISDADGTNTGTKISFDGSGNGTIKLPSTIKASITGNCSGSSGSCTGLAAKATGDGDGNTIKTTYLKLAGGTMTGDLKVQTSTGNQLRLIHGNYGVIFRNDGSNFYVLQTASGSAADGSWNTARPLTINLSTGVCNINGNAATSSSCSGNAATATTASACSGNAATASKAPQLTNARNFYVADNSATNTGPATSFNGTANCTIKLPATIKASITGNCSGSSGSCTGNAATATKLGTATKGAANQPIYLNAGAPTAGIKFSKGTGNPSGGSDGDVYFKY